jgi:photosystem II stability/assembly factor-like uncharacterized protein
MSQPLLLMVGTNKGAFFYHSDGERREWRLTGPHLLGWEVYSLLGDGRGGSPRVLAGTSHMAYGPTLRVSEDLGASWTQRETGPRFSRESGLMLKRIWQIAPGRPAGTLYAGVEDAGLFVSRDRGSTWQEVESLTRHPSRAQWDAGGCSFAVHTILTDSSDARRLWVGIGGVGVFRTDDGGSTWQLRNSGLDREAGGMAVGPGIKLQKLAQHPAQPHTLFAQTGNGVFQSTDGADSWRPINEGLPSRFGFPICVTAAGDLFVIPLDPATRCCVDGQLRVYRRSSGSDQWEPLTQGLPQTPFFVGVLRDCLATDGLRPAGLYFGTNQGDLFCSRDNGEQWDRLPGQFSRITTVKSCVL